MSFSLNALFPIAVTSIPSIFSGMITFSSLPIYSVIIIVLSSSFTSYWNPEILTASSLFIFSSTLSSVSSDAYTAGSIKLEHNNVAAIDNAIIFFHIIFLLLENILKVIVTTIYELPYHLPVLYQFVIYL